MDPKEIAELVQNTARSTSEAIEAKFDSAITKLTGANDGFQTTIKNMVGSLSETVKAQTTNHETLNVKVEEHNKQRLSFEEAHKNDINEAKAKEIADKAIKEAGWTAYDYAKAYAMGLVGGVTVTGVVGAFTMLFGGSSTSTSTSTPAPSLSLGQA